MLSQHGDRARVGRVCVSARRRLSPSPSGACSVGQVPRCSSALPTAGSRTAALKAVRQAVGRRLIHSSPRGAGYGHPEVLAMSAGRWWPALPPALCTSPWHDGRQASACLSRCRGRERKGRSSPTSQSVSCLPPALALPLAPAGSSPLPWGPPHSEGTLALSRGAFKSTGWLPKSASASSAEVCPGPPEAGLKVGRELVPETLVSPAR